MTDLVDFLRARLKDEATAAARAKWAMQGQWYTEADGALDEFVRMMSPDRVLREVEAKRKLLDEYRAELVRRDIYQGQGSLELQARRESASAERLRGLEIAVQCATLPHSDHPDYRQEWRPPAEGNHPPP